MTKPLQLGIIKKQKICPDLQKFNFMIETTLQDNKISQLFIVDIKFDKKNANKKKQLFNEIYTPIFEKNKSPDSSEQSAFQLLDTMRKNDKEYLNL